ncbi:MAG: DUF1559 domain-containing protein [Planctomycetota bacterium]|nr:MAG: DUF1559 domain-containing protein [Planctomycetota bacterium]
MKQTKYSPKRFLISFPFLDMVFCKKVRFCHMPVKAKSKAFTLIELLIIILIISLLMAILLPALSSAREKARRTLCRSHIHQFIIGIHVYSDKSDGKLPSGLSDRGTDEHTPVISTVTRKLLIDNIGDERILICPSMREPFTMPGGWYHNEYGNYGFIIGYNYLGGHSETPWPLVGRANAKWYSPHKVSTSKASIPLVTELNAWTTGGNMTFAPHGKTGAIHIADDFSNSGLNGIPSQEIGAVGGNIGLIDGSVTWKPMEDMKIYRGSRLHGMRGCFAAW